MMPKGMTVVWFLLLSLVGCATIFPPAPRPVAFHSQPPGALVSINGQVVGQTPIAVPLSCTQEQTVAFALTGYEPYTQAVPTVSGWDGRGTSYWPVQVCASVVSAPLRPLGR